MTKLLISLPLSDAAQKYYGSTAPTYNKAGDAGIDLPFVADVKPYDAEVVETIGIISFETVFAMYDLGVCIPEPLCLVDFLSDTTLGCSSDNLDNIETVARYFQPSHFDIRPRSSIGKSPFRLSNAVGTIDKTYRGIETALHYRKGNHWTGDTLGCYLDYHPQLGKARADKHVIYAGDRLLQIVAPSLDNILHVRLDFTEENCSFWSEVIGNKNRGGFGTTSAGTNG